MLPKKEKGQPDATAMLSDQIREGDVVKKERPGGQVRAGDHQTKDFSGDE